MSNAPLVAELGSFVSPLGWGPAVIFPTATALQLFAILRRRTAEGVSVLAWSLFAAANICLYAYTEKYTELPSILATLGTAALNLCIVAAAMRYRKRAARNAKEAGRVPGRTAGGPAARD